MLKKLFFVSLCLLFLFACQQNKSNSTVLQKKAFFDLADYFQTEVDRLEKSNIQLQKKLYLDEKKEEKIIEVFDIQEELAVFSDSNINKTTWLDLYEVDSVLVDNKLARLHYTTTETKMDTKEVKIFFSGTVVDSIQITKEHCSILASTYQTMRYIPAKGFSISNTQQMRFTDEQELNLKVMFLPKS